MKIEEKDIIRAVKEAKGSVGNAAVILRVARKTIYNRICKSSELKAEVDTIIKACKDERKNSKKVYIGKEKRVSITVPKSKTGAMRSGSSCGKDKRLTEAKSIHDKATAEIEVLMDKKTLTEDEKRKYAELQAARSEAEKAYYMLSNILKSKEDEDAKI